MLHVITSRDPTIQQNYLTEFNMLSLLSLKCQLTIREKSRKIKENIELGQGVVLINGTIPSSLIRLLKENNHIHT